LIAAEPGALVVRSGVRFPTLRWNSFFAVPLNPIPNAKFVLSRSLFGRPMPPFVVTAARLSPPQLPHR